MRTNRPRILVDCDGVLSDFANPVLQMIFEKTGDRHLREDVTRWDIFAAIGKKDQEHILTDAVREGGFCSSFPVLEGAQKAINELRTIGDVFVVTSPFDERNWVWERTNWLEEHFGFSRNQIVNTSAKFIVAGDVLIDDSEQNLLEWKEHHPGGLAILPSCPWNAEFKTGRKIRRSNDWSETLKFVHAYAKKRTHELHAFLDSYENVEIYSEICSDHTHRSRNQS